MTDPAAVGGRRAVVEAIRAGGVRDILVAPGVRETQGLRAVIDAAAGAGIDVREADRTELDRLASDHQGVVARLRDDARPRELGERDLGTFPFDDDAFVVVLDGITDPQNFGAAARSAEAAGASVLVTRTRRAADVTPAAIRASAGALLHLPLARVANIPRALDRLQDAGFTVVGLDGDARGVDLRRAVSGRARGARRRQRRRRHVAIGARAMRPAGRAADARAGRLAERLRVARRRAVRLRPALEAAVSVDILG